jgi:hypothetical protein
VEGSSHTQHVRPALANAVESGSVARQIVERPIVGAEVEPPEASIGQVSDTRRELIAQDQEEPEDNFGIGRVVGDHHLRPLASIEIEEEVEDVQAVSERARDDDGAQPGILVVDVGAPQLPTGGSRIMV